MGVVIGLVLIAFGAILTWGVDVTASGLNITAIGVILLVLGLLVIVVDVLWWHTWAAVGPWRRTAYVDALPSAGYVRRRVPPRRRVVVDEEVDGPPGPPLP
jgi:hypothetical protein